MGHGSTLFYVSIKLTNRMYRRVCVNSVRTLCVRFFANLFEDLLGDAEILDRRTADVALAHLPEARPVFGRANHFANREVHPNVTAHKMTVICFSILQLDKLGGGHKRATKNESGQQ